MTVRQSRRARWGVFLGVIIPIGILSRIGRTGSVLFDKYLGDVLYAAMVYAIFRLWLTSRPATLAAAVTMIAIEAFQLTRIAAQLLTSEHLAVRIAARLMGTYFSYLDLLAYAVAIACMYAADSWSNRRLSGTR
jgi:hypothetical protein